MSYNNIILAATEAESTVYFEVPAGRIAILIADGLTGTEYVSVAIRCGTNYVTCYDFDTGNPIQITPTKNPVQLQGPAHYRAVKSATVAATALGLEV